MEFRLEHPEWLWAGLVVVPAAVVALRFFDGMSRGRVWSAILLRAALIGLLIVVAAGLSTVRRSDKLAVVAVVDVSDSVRRFVRSDAGPTLDAVKSFLARAQKGRGPDDVMGTVVFDGRAAVLASPGRGDVAERSLDLRMQEGTDIGNGLAMGAGVLPPDGAGRILLFTDGNQTSGDAIDSARGLASGGSAAARRAVPVDVVPLDYQIATEVIVESVDAPARSTAEAPLTVRVILSSTGDASGTLRLLDNDQPVDANGAEPGTTRRVTLHAGRTVEQIEIQLGPERIHRFRAVFEPDAGPAGPVGDTLADNNAGEAFTLTPGRGSVLIVDGEGEGKGPENGAASTLASTLRRAGIGVTVVAPGAMPADLLALQEYDLVIFQNVPSDAVPRQTQEALVAHVRDLGGGFIMTGGPASFGAGGWRGTPVEAILPVRLDLPARLVKPETAIVFIIDNSGSMGRSVSGSLRTQQEIADEAVALAIRSLDATDLVGVVSFNNDADVVVPLGPNADPGSSSDLVRAIGPGGGTNMMPALEQAHDMLRRVDAKVKHVIVLSDGRSQNEPALAPMAAAMNTDGIKVSTIAIGDASDLESMERIAESGKGVYYQVYDPNILPRVFLGAVRVVRSPMVREVPFEPVIQPVNSPLTAGLTRPPELGGLTLTQARTEPTVTLAMTTPQGEPVLAHWPVELGQVAAFTSDTQKWAAKWIDWPGYGQFWTQAARVIARPAMRRGYSGRLEHDAGRLRLTLEAREEDGRPIDALSVPATVYAPDGRTTEIALAQTAPGVYEGGAPAGGTGTYVAVLKPAQGDKRLTPLVAGVSVSAGVESRTLRSNRGLVESIAATTGGRVLDLSEKSAAAVFDHRGLIAQESLTPVWRLLLIWTIATFLLDVATRRIAWDRFTSAEFGAGIGERATDAVRGRAGGAARTLEGLRARAEMETPASRDTALGEDDAAELARAARDRRRAARLAGLRTDPAAPTPEPPSRPDDTAAPADLASIKKRARERFEREQ